MEMPCVVLMDLTQYGPAPELTHTIEGHYRLNHLSAEKILAMDFPAQQPFALCAEFDFPDITRLATLTAIKRRHPQLPILMVTEQHSEALAVWALRTRIWNYLVKPVDVDLLMESLELLQLARTKNRHPAEHPAFMPSVAMPRESRFRDAEEERRTALRAAENYICAHLSERISVEDVAGACKLPAARFTREFKNVFRTTFSNYVLKRRIQLACEMLRNRSASVSDIGWSVGLRDPSHFTRTFSSFVGMSPSEYRALWQQEHGAAPRALAHAKSANGPANFS